MTDNIITEEDRTKKRAEAAFKAKVREIEGRKASTEYWANHQASIDRIPQLRALRLARDAEQAAASKQSPVKEAKKTSDRSARKTAG